MYSVVFIVFTYVFRVKSSSFEQDTTHRTAYIEFERESAARTALLLNGGNLEGSLIEVSSTDVSNAQSSQPEPQSNETEAINEKQPEEINNDVHVQQEDKPRTAILAQYLAHGYHIGDEAIQKAIDLDTKHGISKRFITYLKKLNQDVGKRVSKDENDDKPFSHHFMEKAQGLIGKAKEIDNQKGISEKSTSWFGPYYQKALNSPYAAKVQNFYSNASKQVLDVHEEALRIAAQKKEIFAQEGGDTSATQVSPPPQSTINEDKSKTA